MNEHELVLQDRSDAGRARWVRCFVTQLAAALRLAAKEVLELRRHLEREPWLDAAPLTEREQLAYNPHPQRAQGDEQTGVAPARKESVNWLLQASRITPGAPWRVQVTESDRHRLVAPDAPAGWLPLKGAAHA